MHWNPAKLSLAAACVLTLAATPALAEGMNGYTNQNGRSSGSSYQGQPIGNTDYSNPGRRDNRDGSDDHNSWNNNERGVNGQYGSNELGSRNSNDNRNGWNRQSGNRMGNEGRNGGNQYGDTGYDHQRGRQHTGR